MSGHSPGPWSITYEGVWAKSPWNATVRIATISHPSPMNGIDGVANARLIAAAPDLLALAQRYEAWEANLVAHGRWEATGDGLPTLTDGLYDELMELQALRNAAIEAALGKPA